MHPKLRALLITIGIGALGILGGRELLAPAPGVTNVQLLDAGIMQCPLRLVRCLLETPGGGRVTREGKARVCSGEPVFSRMAREASERGFTILGCKNVSAATGGESEFEDVAHECACSTGSNCNAQRVLPNGSLAAASALPLWTLAGDDYGWRNPVGAGCARAACNESVAGREWPAECPQQ